jgi:hypothetical protein
MHSKHRQTAQPSTPNPTCSQESCHDTDGLPGGRKVRGDLSGHGQRPLVGAAVTAVSPAPRPYHWQLEGRGAAGASCLPRSRTCGGCRCTTTPPLPPPRPLPHPHSASQPGRPPSSTTAAQSSRGRWVCRFEFRLGRAAPPAIGRPALERGSAPAWRAAGARQRVKACERAGKEGGDRGGVA